VAVEAQLGLELLETSLQWWFLLLQEEQHRMALLTEATLRSETASALVTEPVAQKAPLGLETPQEEAAARSLAAEEKRSV
jgi:hypothetical protein